LSHGKQRIAEARSGAAFPFACPQLSHASFGRGDGAHGRHNSPAGRYRDIQQASRDDPDVHVFTNLTGVGNIEVNAFQRLSRVVIQKSVREGFGLVVSEALWKGTPVVAGRAGGIPLQLANGAGGFLVDSVEGCAERTLWLLRNPEQAQALGASGRELVRQRFLLTRLLADELRLYRALLAAEPAETTAAHVGFAGEPRDPVCGRRLGEGVTETVDQAGERHVFCSEACRHEFEIDPERFSRSRSAA
jgi:trehalose synthase